MPSKYTLLLLCRQDTDILAWTVHLLTSATHCLCEKKKKEIEVIAITGELADIQLKKMCMNLYHSCFIKFWSIGITWMFYFLSYWERKNFSRKGINPESLMFATFSPLTVSNDIYNISQALLLQSVFLHFSHALNFLFYFGI